VAALLIAASESSKVPFFIAGGAFAVWAVSLAWIGLRQPTFPNSARGQRLVMAISFVLAVLAVGTAIATA
jgi:hypothetical protein